MKITSDRAISAVSVSVLCVLLSACSSSSGGDAGGGKALPQISADKLGQPCSGFGTSPGDSATFQDADCGGGYCLVDATSGDFNDFSLYCTADCDVYSCPSGYVCQPNTLGGTQHACFIDPNAAPADGGVAVCEEPTGKYELSLSPSTDENCATLSGGPVDLAPSALKKGCTRKWDAGSCTLTLTCRGAGSDGATIVETDVIDVPVGGGALTDDMRIEDMESSGYTSGCSYQGTLKPD